MPTETRSKSTSQMMVATDSITEEEEDSNGNDHSTKTTRNMNENPIINDDDGEEEEEEESNQEEKDPHDDDEELLLLQLLQSWLQHDSMDFHQEQLNTTMANMNTANDNSKIPNILQHRLLTWYDQHRRRLPWRGDPPPWEGSTAGVTRTIVKKKKNATSKKQTDVAKNGKIQDYFSSTTTRPKRKRNGNKNENDTTKKVDENTNSQNNHTNHNNNNNNNKTYPVSAYGVWVSEIMLQQTRVDAVVPYWIKWMDRFPTVQALAQATPEQVNAHWAGLGFYRRARLLHQASIHIVEQLDGKMPQTAQGLQTLPGIGRYTASAIASIVYHEHVPVVDGNVCRVLARLTGVAQHIKAPVFKDLCGWDLAAALLGGNTSRPGDLNQALMELGATHCAPSGTGVHEEDPFQDFYVSTKLGAAVRVYQEYANENYDGNKEKHKLVSNITNILHNKHATTCPICAPNGISEAFERIQAFLQEPPPQDVSLDDFYRSCGHKAFPLPPPKTAKREEVYAVAAISRHYQNKSGGKAKGDETAWLLVQRPNQGLLAGQWEFPSALLWNSKDDTKDDDKTKKKDKKKTANGNTKKPMATDVPKIPVRQRQRALNERLRNILVTDDNGNTEPEETPSWLDQERHVLPEPLEHVFSHIRHTLWLEHGHVQDYVDDNATSLNLDATPLPYQGARWMTAQDMKEVGITSCVHKVLRAVGKFQENGTINNSTTASTTTTSARKRKR